ncbi:immunity 50 family protein [Enterobacter soli]|uniref:immunity 50 family protein n=1 Tax=Enterobacter soli TaxID=885040 RepID=UPI003EDAAAAA
MYWTELPCNELMKRVFSQPPKIDCIDLFDMQINHDGPSMIINFDLIDILPDNPPAKWGTNFNRCRVGIYCIAVSDLIISGVSKNMYAKIAFDLNGDKKKVTIKGDDLNISFKCSHVHLTGPSVYLSR